jgi:hypothetical protein
MPAVSERAALLLLCRVLSENPSIRASAVAVLSEENLRAAVIALARTERILPALHAAISHFPDGVPRSDRIPLAIAYEANRRRNQQIRNAVIELAAEADRHSIEIVVLKGARWAMEDSVNFAAWRSMLDLDVLVRPGDYEAMPGILAQLGYRSTRRERNFLGQRRFTGHYHLPAHRRADQPFTVEIHRHIGFQPALLPTERIFDSSRLVGPGLRLPSPADAALHAIIHWRIHHFGTQFGFHRVTDGIDIARFLHRDDVKWDVLPGHAGSTGIRPELDAALGTVSELFLAPLPPGVQLSQQARNYVSKALRPRESRLLAWKAKQHQRIERLWHDHRFLYRMQLREAGPAVTRLGLWGLRIRRLPFAVSHLISIALLQTAILIRRGVRSS